MMSSSDKNNSDFTIQNILSSGNDSSELKERVDETKNDQINGEVNDETNAQIVEQIYAVQKSGNEVCRISYQITKLIKENADLYDPSRTCKILDVVVDGGIDYELLHKKIWWVDQLQYRGYDEKWFANGIETSFENSDYVVYPKTKLCVSYHSNLSTSILNRIVCKNLKLLHLRDVTITHSDYKKLTTSQISELSLLGVTVMDENGKKVEIDKLLEETKLVEYLHFKFNEGKGTSETAKKLAQLPRFPKLRDFYLHNVQESFDLKTFGEFLKKNPTIDYCSLWYKCSEEFYEKIQRVQYYLLPTLPSTCKLYVNKYRDDPRLWELSSTDEE